MRGRARLGWNCRREGLATNGLPLIVRRRRQRLSYSDDSGSDYDHDVVSKTCPHVPRGALGNDFAYCEECWDTFLTIGAGKGAGKGWEGVIQERENKRKRAERQQEEDSERELEREQLLPMRLRWKLCYWQDDKSKPFYRNILTGEWQEERPEALQSFETSPAGVTAASLQVRQADSSAPFWSASSSYQDGVSKPGYPSSVLFSAITAGGIPAPEIVPPELAGGGSSSILNPPGSEDEPHVTGMKYHGITLEETAAVEDVLTMISHNIKQALVKEEPAEHSHVKREIVDEGSTLADTPQSSQVACNVQQPSTQQLKFIRTLARGAGRFDPAQNPDAWRQWQHLAQDVEVSKVKFTHGEVSRKFLHGSHKGQSVDDLAKRLGQGYDVSNITPLVVVKCIQEYWVVMGNRRLKSLKAFAASSQQHVRMKCIVHDLDLRHRSVPIDLITKFLDAASTENNGAFATYFAARR